MAFFQNTSGKPFYHPVTNRLVKPNEMYDGAAHMDHEAEQVAAEPEAEAEQTAADSSLDAMELDELKVYAETNGVDLGNATSKNGILKKIKAAESGDGA